MSILSAKLRAGRILTACFTSLKKKTVSWRVCRAYCGECYFSQKLASYLITHSGNYRYNSSESALLTHREKEILNKLRIGASNIEIARSLFISENTVKTHLYNLSKDSC